MAALYLRRSLEPTLLRAAREFPAVVLTGPRQSGKTTLLTRLFAKSHQYVSLDAPDLRASADADPRGFLAQHHPPVILDEIQHAPGLLSYVKEHIDRHRAEPGQFLLTGSQNLLIGHRVTETLAGRAAMLRLLPLSRRETGRQPRQPLPWQTPSASRSRAGASGSELWKSVLRGGYPEIAANPKRDLGLWHASYVLTYLERDVRGLRQIGDLTQFQAFLRLLAARSGQLLDLTDLARELGVAVNTVKAWLSVLEATYQVIVLRPYFANIGKRLVKTPKVYFTDVGTLCYLVGLKDPAHAAAGPMAGAIFETAVLAEIVKSLVHQGREPQVYFWRTAAGEEVDILVDTGETIVPIEVKVSATPRPGMADGISKLRQALGSRVGHAYVVHTGTVRLPLGADVEALPFGAL